MVWFLRLTDVVGASLTLGSALVVFMLNLAMLRVSQHIRRRRALL